MKHENAGKPWIRQSFFRQCFKITISPKIFTAKVLFYTVGANSGMQLTGLVLRLVVLCHGVTCIDAMPYV